LCRAPADDVASAVRQKCYGYLDIETTGLSRHRAELTVVGVATVRGSVLDVRQLCGNRISDEAVCRLLEGVDRVYTYNGSRFDLPFIKARLGLDVKRLVAHTDLMYDCWRHGLKGGLKGVERRLGIRRRLPEVDGYMAVRLWWDYVNNSNRRALSTLLEYNREDVVNLHTLRQMLAVS
jgi:hypothetical protein